MKIVFRVDSSHLIGTGHVMRCLTLAEYCRDRGDDVAFVCRDHPGNISGLVEQQGFNLLRLPYKAESESDSPTDEYASWLSVPWELDAAQSQATIANSTARVDWLVVDHYALDNRWQNQLRSVADRIMVIDDLANRPHECDLLLDHNFYQNPHQRYLNLVPSDCLSLLGSEYALLRKQFSRTRQTLRIRTGRVKNVLVFFGGADYTNETEKTLEAIEALGSTDLTWDVIVGQSNQNRDHLREICARSDHLSFHTQVENMADMMSKVDLAIGAAGTTSWERACLGLPCLMTVVANNQTEIAANAHRIGMARLLGRSEEVCVEDIVHGLTELLNNPELVRTMSENATATVDGLGVSRVGEAISQVCKSGVPQ